MEKKHTATQWLVDWMGKNQYFIGNDLLKAFEQAKAMEKEQIMDAHLDGQINWEMSGKQYYNENFKSE